MSNVKQLIFFGILSLCGNLTVWSQSILCNETPISITFKSGMQTDGEIQIYFAVTNKGTGPVYISTNPIQINGSPGFYFSLQGNDPSTLLISSRVFAPIIYSPYSSHRFVTLQKLEPKQSFPFMVNLRFPISETLPPVEDPREARVIGRKEIEKVTFELGFFGEDVTLEDLLKSKPFGWTVNGDELLYTGVGKGKHLSDIQQLVRCSTKIPTSQ
jgi:hypothetical protein